MSHLEILYSEEASGIGSADVISELRLILEEEALEQAESVVVTDQDLLEGRRRKGPPRPARLTQALAGPGEYHAVATGVGLRRQLAACAWRLSTIILPGAPFWTLWSLLKLRDAIQPQPDKHGSRWGESTFTFADSIYSFGII
jgi:hypothetical protein